MAAFQAWLAQLYLQLGYGPIFVLMALESSVFPVPSELVMIPAGYRVHSGQLDGILVLLCAGAASVAGALFNYAIGRFGGRVLLLSYGKYLLINERKYHEAEALFLRNSHLATFIGRFIPVIRHLISLPAGVFGMPLVPFMVLTALGSTIWCAILMGLGYFFGEPVIRMVLAYTHEVGIAAVLLTLVAVAWFLLRRQR